MNENIISEFKRLIRQIQFDIDNSSSKKQQITNMFRLQSIKKAIKALENFPKKIINIDQLKDTENIGKGSLARIDEILKTGKLKEIKEDALNKNYLKYIDELVEVFGIGRKTALELFKNHNIKSIDELKKLYKQGKIELPDNIIKGLKYYGKFKENIPRAEVDLIGNVLQGILYSINIELYGVICGSYRRLQASSNDIDMMIVHPSYKSKTSPIKINYLNLFITKLKEEGYLIESFTSSDVSSKFMGIIQLSKKHPMRRLDIRFIPYESYYYALVYFTGPKDFNRTMRQLAINNDYILNEYGLYDKNGKMFKAKSEEDIFKLLGMEYVSPEKRK